MFIDGYNNSRMALYALVLEDAIDFFSKIEFPEISIE